MEFFPIVNLTAGPPRRSLRSRGAPLVHCCAMKLTDLRDMHTVEPLHNGHLGDRREWPL